MADRGSRNLQPDSNEHLNLTRSMAVGAGWMVLLRFADRAIGLISLAILARLLLPEDFGLIALAMSFIAVVEMFGELAANVVLGAVIYCGGGFLFWSLCNRPAGAEMAVLALVKRR